jgi:hypothetical protein
MAANTATAISLKDARQFDRKIAGVIGRAIIVTEVFGAEEPVTRARRHQDSRTAIAGQRDCHEHDARDGRQQPLVPLAGLSPEQIRRGGCTSSSGNSGRDSPENTPGQLGRGREQRQIES